MKLPRYLQIALLLTGALVLYTLLSDDAEDIDVVTGIYRIQQAVSEDKNSKNAEYPKSTGNFVNLFPPAIKPQSEKVVSQEIIKAPEIVTPPLPFKVIGAWWSEGQRTLVLQDAGRQWIICQHCRATEPIWIGMQITPEWKLRGISADRLTFVWLPQMREQHLALGAMNTEPTF